MQQLDAVIAPRNSQQLWIQSEFFFFGITRCLGPCVCVCGWVGFEIPTIIGSVLLSLGETRVWKKSIQREKMILPVCFAF